MPGAIMGTTMNTIKASDITSAMARPTKQSRTIETAITRVAAAPRPCSSRNISSTSKLGASTALSATTT